jgi:hypothetical protein
MNVSGKLGALGIAVLASVAVVGCGGSPAASATPAWAKALGSGVTVQAGPASAGDNSPGGTLMGVVAADQAGNYKGICAYYPPAQQAGCDSTMGSTAAATLKSALPTYKNIVVTYTAIKGTEALVGVTGSVCTPNQTPSCFSNTDPAAIFDTGKTFDALWSETSSADSRAYSLAQLIEVGGKWYLDASSS